MPRPQRPQSRIGGAVALEEIEEPWRALFIDRLRRAKDDEVSLSLNATDRVMLVRPQNQDLFEQFKSLRVRLPVSSIYDATPLGYLREAWRVASPAQRRSFRELIGGLPDDESPISPMMRSLAETDEEIALAVELREQALGTPARHTPTGHVAQMPRQAQPLALIAEMARRGLPGAAEGKKAARAARDAAKAAARKPAPKEKTA